MKALLPPRHAHACAAAAAAARRQLGALPSATNILDVAGWCSPRAVATRVQRNKNMGKLQAGYLFPEVRGAGAAPVVVLAAALAGGRW